MNIGFCGTGMMGAPMAQRLLARGHNLTVWNRSPDKAIALTRDGALLAEHPVDAMQGADLVVLCLFDELAVESVLFTDDAIRLPNGPRWIVDHSSTSPHAAAEFAGRIPNSFFIDAPVSGGVRGAREGALTVMAGGDAGAIEQVTPVLKSYATRVTRLGPVGCGQAAKICNQLMVSATLSAIAEMVTLSQVAGLDPMVLCQALTGGWADSALLQIFLPRMALGDPLQAGTLRTMYKDVRNISRLADSLDIRSPIATAVEGCFEKALALGLGEKDLSALVEAWRANQ